MSHTENGVLVFSASIKKPIIISIADDIKVMVKLEDNRLKMVIEAPKDIPIQKLRELEKQMYEQSLT